MSNRTRRSLGLGVLLAVLSGCTIHVYESTGTKTGGQASSGGEAAGGQGDGDRDGADDRDDAQDEDRDGAEDEDRDQDEHTPSTGGGDKPSTGGGDKPSTGGGDKPSTGGGDKPSTGGGDKPSTGGGDKPSTGGGDKPSTGGGDKPSTGGGDTPATKPPVLKPPVLKPPVVKPPVKPKPDDKPVDPHAGHDGDDGKHDDDTAHGGGTGANPEPGKPQRTEPGHRPKPNLDVDRPVVPAHGSVVTAPDKNKRPSAAHGSLHLPTSAARTALAPDVCRLYAHTFRPGARLRVKVEGVPDSAELYLDGEKLEMVRRDPKAWVAKLPADAKSGVVILQSGKDAVSCGRIDVK